VCARVRASPRFNVGATQVVERFVTRCIIKGLQPNGRCNKLMYFHSAKPPPGNPRAFTPFR